MWVARDYNNILRLWMIKPHRGNTRWHYEYTSMDNYYSIVINDDNYIYNKYDYIKWEDEPVEVEIVEKDTINKDIDDTIIRINNENRLYKHTLETIQAYIDNVNENIK